MARISPGGRIAQQVGVKPYATNQRVKLESAPKQVDPDYEKKLASYNKKVQEARDWEQAEKLAGKIQLGKPIRYDPQSSVGKKINAYLDNWTTAAARRENATFSKPIKSSEVSEVSPGLYKYRDPNTGKLSYTSSREFAESSAETGTPKFTKEYQQSYQGTIPTTSTIDASDYFKPKEAESYFTKEVVEIKDNIPTTEVKYVEPYKLGPYQTTISRRATEEERKMYERETKSYFVSSEKMPAYKPALDVVKGGYEKLEGGVKESIISPTIGGIDVEKARSNIAESTQFLESKGVPKFISKGGEFVSGVGVGWVSNIQQKPLKYGLIYGASLGAGSVISSSAAGAAALRPSLGIATKVGSAGVGTYFGSTYAWGVGKKISAASTWEEKGEVAGTSTLETGAMGLGFTRGQKLFEQTRGIWRTAGLAESEILTTRSAKLKTEFPEAGKNLPFKERAELHKKLFEKGEQVDIFKSKNQEDWAPGYHMAPRPLEGLEITKPLHISTEASPHFLELQGGKYQLIPKVWQKSYWKDLFKVPGKPTGYAISPTKGYKAVVGREFKRGVYSWEEPVMGTTGLEPTAQSAFFKYKGIRIPVYGRRGKGIAYTPGSKSEIQAVFETMRGKASSKTFVSETTKLPNYSIVSPSSISFGSYISKPSVVPSSYKYSTVSSVFKSPVSSGSYKSSISSIPPSVSSTLSSSISSGTYKYPIPTFTFSSSYKSTPTNISLKYSPYKYKTISKEPIKIELPSPTPPSSKTTKQGYIPQVKTSTGWKPLSKEPMTRTAALGRMARTVDNTVAAQGRIIPTKGKVSKTTDDYFSKKKSKLRPYKIKKGVPLKMYNQFIEKRAKRIDTSGEKKGLRASQYVKKNKWLIGTRKKKKKKSPWLV